MSELTIVEVFDANTLPQNANSAQLREISKEKANFICQKIHNLANKLKEAENLSEDAMYFVTDDGFFSRTFGRGKTAIEKRSELNAEVNIMQNEAIAELANLVQASINFAASSALLNQAMIRELSKVAEEGFIDVYGEIEQIRDEREKEYLAQIEDGLKANQRQHQQSAAVSQNKASISQNTERITQNQELIEQNARAISQLQKTSSKGAMVVACLALLLSIISLAVSLADKF